MPQQESTESQETRPATVSMSGLCGYFLRLGALGFGGPIALVGYMQRDLVEKRGWITEDDFREGLALAQLAPGPLAAQLAIYLGWVRGRVLGATLAGIAFILPSFVIVLFLSALYLRYGGLSWMEGAFYGIGASVIAIIVRSAVKLVRLTLAKDVLLWLIFVTSAVITAWSESEILWVFLGSGVVALFIKTPPRFRRTTLASGAIAFPAWLLSGLRSAADAGTLWRLGLYFAEAGAFVFGSGLAIVPFLYGGVVDRYHWLTDQQFLDAVAVAMITPGPVVITVAFIGYLVAGPVGATVAAIGVFLPCYLFVIVPAPYFRQIARNRQVKSFVDGVTAAATGAIAGAAFVLGRRAIIDIPTMLIALTTLALLSRIKRVPEPLVIVGAGILGIIVRRWSA